MKLVNIFHLSHTFILIFVDHYKDHMKLSLFIINTEKCMRGGVHLMIISDEPKRNRIGAALIVFI